jgi:hypothetical protein
MLKFSSSRLTRFAPLGLAAFGVVMGLAACSVQSKRSGFNGDDQDAGFEGGLSLTPGDQPCSGLECKRAKCDDPDTTTTITGKVYDPAGANGLYNVMVYIPGGFNGDDELPPIPDGVQCETCASIALNPMVSTLTDTKGEFVLKDVPVDKDVPVVIQIGKWRRKLTFDVTKKCAENAVPDRDFRLPKNGSEGDMPQIAVTTGGCDALEGVLRGIGVEDSEFVPGDSPAGHIHMFNGEGGRFPGAPNAGGSASDPMGGELWNDSAKMAKYDMVMLSCECDTYDANKGGEPGASGTPADARQAMWDYANMGGKIFASHYHYTWFKDSPQDDWKVAANWDGSFGAADGQYTIDQSFPKGASFADWLVNVNASSSPGTIQLTDVTTELSNVNPPAQSWIAKSDTSVRYFSFNTPTTEAPENQCGRAVYAGLHTGGIASGGLVFPDGLPTSGGLSAQQKALEFMFFDLSGCVQSDDTPPEPPH